MIWHNKISECGLQISDFKYAANLIYQSAIRNLKSAIDFTPVLVGYLNLKGKIATIGPIPIPMITSPESTDRRDLRIDF
jgi:hypothetical protein